MKKLLCLICALVLSISAFGVIASAEENSDGADKIYTLFNMSGGFIVEDPIDTSETTEKPWLLVGKDVFMTDNGGYPAPFDNPFETSSFYYLTGSNRIDYVGDVDSTLRDFAVEYTVNYAEESEGYVAVALSYNYKYYIEAYITPDGRGDIVIVAGENRISALDSASVLSSTDGSRLTDVLSGDGKLPDTLAVCFKVSVNSNKSPKKIDVYVNGSLVGTTGAGFIESVENFTPEYDRAQAEGEFNDKLGNIIALEFSPAAKGEINNIYVYAIDETDPGLNAEAQKYYAERYGNASLVTENQDVQTDEIQTETTENETVGDENILDSDTILTVALIMGGVCIAIVLVALVILIVRKRYL